MRITFLLCLLVFPLLLKAQFIVPTSKKLGKLAGRTILVELKETDRRTMLELNHNPDQQAYYKEELAEENALLQKSIEENWEISNEIEFASRTKIRELVKMNPDNYAVFRMQWESVYEVREEDEVFEIEAYVVSLRIGDFLNNTIFSICLPSKHIDAIDYSWIMQTFDKVLRHQSLNTKTNYNTRKLYVDEVCLKTEKLLSKSWFDAETVLGTYFSINEQIEQKKEELSYCSLIWSKRSNTWEFILIEAKTSSILARKSVLITSIDGFALSPYLIKSNDWGIYSYRSKLILGQIPLKHFLEKTN